MNTEIVRGLCIRHAAHSDQPNSIKLELACKLPSLHDPPPVPSKHLTRCPRNRVQAILSELIELDHRINQQTLNEVRSSVTKMTGPGDNVCGCCGRPF